MSDIKSKIAARIASAGSEHVWVPTDFAQLGTRAAIDKALQRMVLAGELRRIDRGLYDQPAVANASQQSPLPNYQAVVEAIARRDQIRLLVDEATAANDLGLTDAVPVRVTVYTETRRKSIKLDKLIIEFKQRVPIRLYWAGRPAMRVVQVLYWLKSPLAVDRSRVMDVLTKILVDPVSGPLIRQDLIQGFAMLPAWMHGLVRELPGCDPIDDLEIGGNLKNDQRQKHQLESKAEAAQ